MGSYPNLGYQNGQWPKLTILYNLQRKIQFYKGKYNLTEENTILRRKIQFYGGNYNFTEENNIFSEENINFTIFLFFYNIAVNVGTLNGFTILNFCITFAPGLIGGILFFIVAIILSVCTVKICNKRRRRKQERGTQQQQQQQQQ